MSSDMQLTPMMAQYRRIKSELPKDALLLFRLGDFYELFFEDAQAGAQILNVSLTQRNGVPMCGIPFHAANTYIARILRQGRKVAICDQVEEAKPGKLVQREVTSILSPGTHFDDRLLNAERNNFLASVYAIGQVFGLAVVDLTTGDFRVTELEGERALLTELERLRPAELTCQSENKPLADILRRCPGQLSPYDDWTFVPETATFTLHEHFKVASLDGYGLRNRPAAIGAAGGVLHYLVNNLRRDVTHLTRLAFYQVTDFLVLDSVTLRNLEILEPLHRDAARNTSLFGAYNRTATPMGARKLRDWLSQPLASAVGIRRRQEAVAMFLACPSVLESFRAQLKEVRDLERTLGRLSLGSGNGRDLVALRLALEQIPGVQGHLQSLTKPGGPVQADDPSLVEELASQLDPLPDLVDELRRAIVDEPPLTVKDGGLIRPGYNAELDEIQTAARDGKAWIAALQQQEVERTGIPSLKIRFNSVFGYYIEVTKSHLAKVPPEYTRKQTVATGERFITPGLKEMEGKILGAEERGGKLEYELFLQVREKILARLPQIQKTAGACAQLDVLAAFADHARLHGHCRPDVGDDGMLDIRDGRHPVLELHTDERFVPNDTILNPSDQQIALITGPNMAGKSTFIRQAALLVLIAHTGAYVPAASARIDLVDRIFTRIGASDDLARGQSTFMVEMSETANILNNATRRSLVILDEIGRGTSTFDGLSLAWSIVEHLHHQVGAKTLFATHYHELTELAGRLPRVRNFNVAVREWNDQIIFLHKIHEGGTDKSYGIQVARLAGVPRPVIERSKVILRILEEAELDLQRVIAPGEPAAESTPEPRPARAGRRAEREKLKRLVPTAQLDLFSNLN